MSAASLLASMRVIESEHCADWKQVRFPRRHKASRRWVKKYQRDKRNWSMVPWDYVLVMHGNTIMCHPAIAARVREQLRPLSV